MFTKHIRYTIEPSITAAIDVYGSDYITKLWSVYWINREAHRIVYRKQYNGQIKRYHNTQQSYKEILVNFILDWSWGMYVDVVVWYFFLIVSNQYNMYHYALHNHIWYIKLSKLTTIYHILTYIQWILIMLTLRYVLNSREAAAGLFIRVTMDENQVAWWHWW